MLGYADDIMLLSPTLEGLQGMVARCAAYMSVHNLSLGPHPDPRKCKAKCLAYLNGNDLPWVTSTKHLGSKVEKRIKGTTQDLIEKRAIFIKRNNELLQEFHLTHPVTLIRANNASFIRIGATGYIWQ